MSQQPDCVPAPVAIIAELLPDSATADVLALADSINCDWLTWGAEHAETATAKQRQTVIDAIVLTETGHLGVEAAPTNSDDGSALRLAQSRRLMLMGASSQELVQACRIILRELASRHERHVATMNYVKDVNSKKGRDLSAPRYWYVPPLEEVARHFRGQGITCNRALQRLTAEPYCCGGGTTVSAEKAEGGVTEGRLVITRMGKRPAGLSWSEFQKKYWVRAK
jgi:hypothetical protein